jgi:hypothetical protein
MVNWRIGKNYTRICPACPRTPAFCLNSLEETTHFLTTDVIWAIYETQCTEIAPATPFNWFKKNSLGTWDLIASYIPVGPAPTAQEAWISPQPNGCYKVEYNGKYTEFTVGTGICATGQIGIGALVLGLGVTAVLIGGLVYYITRKPETVNITRS